jgi:hypothetical protein
MALIVLLLFEMLAAGAAQALICCRTSVSNFTTVPGAVTLGAASSVREVNGSAAVTAPYAKFE